MQIVIRWAISAAALYATIFILQLLGLARVVPESVWYSWFIAVIIMALVNALIRPIARLLTAPLNCLTFGIIGIVVNGVMFWLVSVVAEAVGYPVFSVTPVGAVLGALLVGAIGGLINHVFIRRDDRE